MDISRTSLHYRAQIFTFGKIHFTHLCPYFHMSWLAMVLAPVVALFMLLGKILFPVNMVIDKVAVATAPVGAAFVKRADACLEWNTQRRGGTNAQKAARAAQAQKRYVGRIEAAFASGEKNRIILAMKEIWGKLDEEALIVGEVDGWSVGRVMERRRFVLEDSYDAVFRGIGNKWRDYIEFDDIYGEDYDDMAPWAVQRDLITKLWDELTADEQAAYTAKIVAARELAYQRETKRKLVLLKIGKAVSFIGQSILALGIVALVALASVAAWHLGGGFVAHWQMALKGIALAIATFLFIYGIVLLDNKWDNVFQRGVACVFDTIGFGISWVWERTFAKLPKVFGKVFSIIIWPLGKIAEFASWMWDGALDIITMIPELHKGICPELDFKD